MPFKSKAQSRACFASKGFDGSVDCMKWAKSTQYKKLPARVKKPKNKLVVPSVSNRSFYGDGIPGVKPEELMAPHLPGLRGAHMLPGIGHWTQQEAPAAVNALLLPA